MKPKSLCRCNSISHICRSFVLVHGFHTKPSNNMLSFYSSYTKLLRNRFLCYYFWYEIRSTSFFRPSLDLKRTNEEPLLPTLIAQVVTSRMQWDRGGLPAIFMRNSLTMTGIKREASKKQRGITVVLV